MKQLAAYKGPFGKVRIVERLSDGARSFLTGSSLQTLIDANGTSLFGYVNALKLLLRDRKKVLMLGGAGGSLANMLARKGHKVTVVDIDPEAERVARQYFWLDARVTWITDDGLTYPQRCRDRFDAIVVDACTSEGTADGFVDASWLAGLMTRLRPDGVLMLNLAFNLVARGTLPTDGFTLAERLAKLGFHSLLWRPEYGWEGNEILLVSQTPVTANLNMVDILDRPAEARSYLLSLKPYRVMAH